MMLDRIKYKPDRKNAQSENHIKLYIFYTIKIFNYLHLFS